MIGLVFQGEILHTYVVIIYVHTSFNRINLSYNILKLSALQRCHLTTSAHSKTFEQVHSK